MKIFKFLKKNWLKILFYLMLIIAFMLYIYIFVFMLALLYYFIQIYLIADIGKENNDRSFLLFTALSSLIVWLKYVFESPFSLNSLIKNKTSTEWKDFSKNLIYIFVSNFLSNICFNLYQTKNLFKENKLSPKASELFQGPNININIFDISSISIPIPKNALSNGIISILTLFIIIFFDFILFLAFNPQYNPLKKKKAKTLQEKLQEISFNKTNNLDN
ncbi:hypothetical protein LMB75_05870 [Limosilactobacillus reuteri]|uniref:hypothetical protein n=1 Tax=Limosilactobacillus reuteri TaxID=1598 RepID=UPI001E440327|nr:hypothetical protein [Limosilactobacillus reuteri]MCC4405622.1 hypothetical protein [Limosilactobacillus reuteri]